jgi:chromate transport protein ChrA
MALLGTVIGGTDSSLLPAAVLYLQNGLASAAVALIAAAAYKLGSKLCTTPVTKYIAAAAASLTTLFKQQAWLIPAVMVLGGAVAYYDAVRSKVGSYIVCL